MNMSLEIFLYICVGVLGLLIGSFLNVVILRLHTKTISKGRSKCATCSHTLNGFDLIPVFSFLFLIGRCRYCKSRLSKQYIIVEILTVVTFVGILYKILSTGILDTLMISIYFVYFAIIFCLLIAMAVYDLKHFVLPWKLMKPFLLITFIGSILIAFLNNDLSFVNFVSGFLVASIFWAIWYFSKGTLIGFGDILLMLGFGFMVGTLNGFSAVLFGFWIGAIYFLLKMLFTFKFIKGKTMIPFGPFLIAGLYVVFFCGVNLNSLVNSLI